jgi:hypothetical protein
MDSTTSIDTAPACAAAFATATARVSLVLFRPGDLFNLSPPLTFFEAAKRTFATGAWEDLAKLLSRSREGDPKRFPDPDIAKRARGAWVPGVYRGTHGHAKLAADFISTDLLVVDVDAGDPHAVAEMLSAYAIIVHSTYKYTPTTPRCRIVFRLECPCNSAADYNVGLRFIAGTLNAKGFKAPAKDSTLGKLAYLPMHQPGVEPVFIVSDGRPLGLDRIVQAESRREAFNKSKPKGPTRTANVTPAYRSAAVRRASDAIAAARSGERHNVLYREAASLGRPELGLDEHPIVAELLSAARHADPDEHPDELERTIHDAIEKARGGS